MSTGPWTAWRDRPDLLLQKLWDELARGASDATAACHWPTLATVEDGEPRARTVVLREVNRAARLLICQVDNRSPKVAQIEQQPIAEWVFHDLAARWQLRARGATRIHRDDELADRRWSETPANGRAMYLAPHAPGTSLSGPQVNLPADIDPRSLTLTQTEPGRANFCVLATTVTDFDLYDLDPAGHVRHRWIWNGRSWDSRWIAT